MKHAKRSGDKTLPCGLPMWGGHRRSLFACGLGATRTTYKPVCRAGKIKAVLELDKKQIMGLQIKSFRKIQEHRDREPSLSMTRWISSKILVNAVAVLWDFLKPDWKEVNKRLSSMWRANWSNKSFSVIFDRTGRMLMGLKSASRFAPPDLGSGTTNPTFKKEGKEDVMIT
jgi:hypothetical protein